MEDEFNINVCYKKVFELLGSEGTIENMVCDIAKYTGTRIAVVDIGGKILSASEEPDMRGAVCKKRKEMILRLIARYIEEQKEELPGNSILIKEKEGIKTVNRIVVKGNTEGFCIMEPIFDQRSGCSMKELICQVNDILCQALGFLMERYGRIVSYHASALQRMIARSFFDEEAENGLEIKEIRSMYDTYVRPDFIVSVLEMGNYNMLRLQKAANHLADTYPDSYIYIKENRIYVLFSDVHANDVKKRIHSVLEVLCDEYGFFCGLSESFEDVDLVGNKCFMTVKALEMGKVSEPERKIHMEYDYYIQAVCSCAVSYIGRARYLEKELLKLKNEDHTKGTDFYRTLKEYLLQGNNVSMTSKKLFIHRNTMIYRLGKINEILGVDINDPAVSKCLMISMILQEQEWMK